MALNDPARDAPNAPDLDCDAAPYPAIDLTDADDDLDAEGDIDLCFAPEPLTNPPAAYRLSTELYDSLEDLEADLHQFAALAGFCVVRKRACNLVKGFGFNRYDFEC
ncbi:hypothetical protein B0T24DRAFT_636135 [Lasiosphaeria ovina]|uniref:Uncharacterized protein n=1 Tax=Lasiosphaeria ovina TaxID=92902 RepID=A0AAE0MZR2_9PEZI|nr:hypothetical protein B0T24DRAFT_636135 [Lasiosphaeria ovina]